MIICDSKRTSKFKDVLYGSAFLWNGEYYMRTEVTYKVTSAGTRSVCNAVKLNDGSMINFQDNETVHNVNGHFEVY